MLRYRRYRGFIACATIVIFLLYQVSRNSRWDAVQQSFPGNTNSRPVASKPNVEKVDIPAQKASLLSDKKAGPEEAPAVVVAPKKEDRPQGKVPELKTNTAPLGAYATGSGDDLPTKSNAGAVDVIGQDAGQTTQAAELRPPYHRQPGPVEDLYQGASDGVHIGNRLGAFEGEALVAPTTIHWQKPTERFPIPEQSLIPLPTGKPKALPQVQAKFKEETPEAKGKRLVRRNKVKAEAQHAWAGYKKFAWTHDELRPVTKRAKDPFCGWAATLVDSLDTLWIMGMKDDFEEAVQAVKDIDFTTTPFRSDIPVFETTIRYLGGLLAAYDVSGGHSGGYQILLDKALELAEILMGVFDTPNRMPILYYNWKNTFSANPKRASTSASVAELGSLAMEFTRLAQLTGKDKYYDAIARITDAFEEYQNRGTAVPGLFPQRIDASGCNRTAQAALTKAAGNSNAVKQQSKKATDLDIEPQGHLPSSSQDKKRLDKTKDGPDLEFRVVPGSHRGDPATAEIRDLPEAGKVAKRGEIGRAHEVKDFPFVDGSEKAQKFDQALKHNYAEEAKAKAMQYSGSPLAADGEKASWECVPQGLTSGGYGVDDFSMGGSQDSTYEYFPKQYILLGGLEPKYKTINEKVIQGIKKYLLFRPMIKDNSRDILFSGKAYSRDSVIEHLTFDWEVTHLTCFLGGMFGLSGKIFDRPEDVEIGKKLADGCAWAYEAFPTGIMPEYAMITPCKNSQNCQWNETAWHNRLDPKYASRDLEVEDYYERKNEWRLKMKELELQEALMKKAEDAARAEKLKNDIPKGVDVDEQDKLYAAAKAAEGLFAGDSSVPSGQTTPELKERAASVSMHKRGEPSANEKARSTKDTRSGVTASQAAKAKKASQESTETTEINKKAKKLDEELDINTNNGHEQFGGVVSQAPLIYPIEPIKPMTHKEFVAQRIETEHLPPGFVMLNDRRYILRPEAIESIWYMYRITGDPIWQDKGWRMFESIVKWTKTDVGHSALDDVTFLGGEPTQTDSMESFWLAETLKYFYLLFEDPDVISLDEWVLNTEAHPFKRPT